MERATDAGGSLLPIKEGKSMKGRTNRYASGGKIRNIGGVKAPAYGSNAKLISMAKGKTTGSARMDGPEGKPAKPNLARPGRKAGGRVCKADGGSTISEDSKQTAAKLRKEAAADLDAAPKEMMSGFLPIALGAAVHGLSRGRLGKAAGYGLAGAGAVGGTASGAARLLSEGMKKREADRIEKGLVKPGEEDRKWGGRTKRKDKDGDDD